MATVVTTSRKNDYLLALTLEQDDIMQYFISEEHDDQQQQINNNQTLSNDDTLILLEHGIGMDEINQLYPDTQEDKKRNQQSIAEHIDYKQPSDFWHRQNFIDSHYIEPDYKYMNRTTNLLMALNKKWQSFIARKEKKENKHDLVIKQFMFHSKEESDFPNNYFDDKLDRDHYNVLYCHLRINAQIYNFRVTEMWSNYDMDNTTNHIFETSVEINERKLRIIRDSLEVYLLPHIVSMIMDDMLELDENIDHPLFQTWMLIYGNGSCCNVGTEYFDSSEMEKCFRYSRLLEKFMDLESVEQFEVDHGTITYYSVC